MRLAVQNKDEGMSENVWGVKMKCVEVSISDNFEFLL